MPPDLISVQLNSGRTYLIPRALLVRMVRACPDKVLPLIAGAAEPHDLDDGWRLAGCPPCRSPVGENSDKVPPNVSKGSDGEAGILSELLKIE